MEATKKTKTSEKQFQAKKISLHLFGSKYLRSPILKVNFSFQITEDLIEVTKLMEVGMKSNEIGLLESNLNLMVTRSLPVFNRCPVLISYHRQLDLTV